MRKQEQSRLAELAAEKVHYEAIQAQNDIVSAKDVFHAHLADFALGCLTEFCLRC